MYLSWGETEEKKRRDEITYHQTASDTLTSVGKKERGNKHMVSLTHTLKLEKKIYKLKMR